MTLLWIDGFDHYGSTANLINYGTYAQNEGSLSTSVKRTGTTSLELSSNDDLRRVFPGAQTEVGVGLAFYLSTLPNVAQYVMPIRFGGSSGYGQCFLLIDPDGYLALWSGHEPLTSNTGIEIVRTDTPVITSAAWQHLEAAYVPNGASSTIEVRLNGVTVINETFAIGSVSYGETTATSVSNWQARASNTTALLYLDDVFCWNGSGSFNNDFLGDKKVHTMMPNGDTATADWSKSSGSVGYDRINEIPPDGDTTYLYAATSGLISMFDFAAMPSTTGVINGLQTYRATRKTDAGTCDVRTDIQSSSSSTTGTSQPATTAFQYYTDIFETDPATGALWTKSAVDAAQVKINRTA